MHKKLFPFLSEKLLHQLAALHLEHPAANDCPGVEQRGMIEG